MISSNVKPKIQSPSLTRHPSALKTWVVKEPATPAFVAEMQELGYHPLTAQLLYNRGLQTRAMVEDFFQANYTHLGDPFDIKDMAKAVERIRQAINSGECIAIYGDFDADGVTACSLLVQFFGAMGVKVVPRIPHRVDEGYGLNIGALRRLVAEHNIKLVITVDCGVSNHEEIALAKSELGLDVIVTDHHRPPDVLPTAYAILNTRQPGDIYPDKGLTGVGVAYHLVRALSQVGIKPPNLRPNELLDLVALGTVADIGPLRGENRILVKSGLKALNKTTRPGIVALVEAAGLKQGQLNATSIGFGLAPRINAAGRIDDAIMAYELLLTEDLSRARELAQNLNVKNKERQQLLAAILQEARARIETEGLARDQKIIVISGEGWAAGVVGLVAGRLCEEYHRPVLVMEQGVEISKGSARSIFAFNMVEALAECADLLERYGGHRQAAGFSIKNTNLPEFGRRLQELAAQRLDDSQLLPQLQIDAVLKLNEVVNAFKASQILAPFGSENPTPVFASYGLKVKFAKPVGVDGAHLRLRLYNPLTGITIDAFARGDGARAPDLLPNTGVDVAYTLEINEWQGQEQIEMKILDIKQS